MTTSYSSIQKTLHWFVFFFVVGLYGITYLEEYFPRDDPGRAWIWRIHISFGMLLLAAVILRLGIRLSGGAPAIPENTGPMERRLAAFVHGILYALIVVVPVIGIFVTWFRGNDPTMFGFLAIPTPFQADREIAHDLKELHEVGANLILAVAGAHALAALWHHYVRGDDSLRRMLPRGGNQVG